MDTEDIIKFLLSRIESLSAENGRLQNQCTAQGFVGQDSGSVGTNYNINLQCLFPLIAESLKDRPNRINQLKEIRTLTGAGLKESKDMLMAVYASVNKPWDQG